MRSKLLGYCLILALLVGWVGCVSVGLGTNNTRTLTTIAVTPSGAGILVGTAQRFSATGTYSDGTIKNIGPIVTWSSTPAGLVTIDSTGLVTAVAAGAVTITATSGSIQGSAPLTVDPVGPQLVSIAVAPSGAAIPVGTTQQFSATGTFSNGSTQNLGPTVTWSALPAGLVTISATGLATAVAPGPVTITATSTIDPISGSAPFTVNPPALLSISVTPLGPAIETGGAVQLTATGHYSDNTTKDLTGSAVWASSVGGVASVAGGLVTGIVAGQTTITATSGSVGSTAVNVVTPPVTAPALNGNYVFSFTGMDPVRAQFYAGVFHANPPNGSGDGTIDSGEVDSNTATGVTNAAITGSYTIYPDGRGTLVLTPAGGTSTTFKFVLAAGGTTGLAVEFDGLGTTAGSFELQDAGPFDNTALTGKWVFSFKGLDSASNQMGEVGVFDSVAGDGNITGGLIDLRDFGFPTSDTLTASTYTIPADGRGTLSLIRSMNPTITSNFVVYIVSATKIRLMQTDAGTSTVLSGVAEQQVNNNFTDTALKGGYAFLLDRAPSPTSGTFDVIGRAFFDGLTPGTITGGTEEEVGVAGQNTISGTYDVATNGRVDVLMTTSTSELRNYTLYMVSPTRAYMLDEFTPWSGTGRADLQDVTLDNSTLSGNYALSGASIGQNDTALNIWLNADGAGNLSGVADVFSTGVPSSVVISNTIYNVTPNGRTFVTLPTPSPVVVTSFTFYVVSPTEAWMLGAQPALDGVLLQQ